MPRVITVTLAALMLIAGTTLFAEDGAAIYKSKCATCHAANGSGDTPAGKSMKVKDLRSADVQKQTDLQLTDTIAGGKGKMLGYGKKLSTAEIQSLIAFIRTLKAK